MLFAKNANKRLTKKILSAVTTVALAVSLCFTPATAWANPEGDGENLNVNDNQNVEVAEAETPASVVDDVSGFTFLQPNATGLELLRVEENVDTLYVTIVKHSPAPTPAYTLMTNYEWHPSDGDKVYDNGLFVARVITMPLKNNTTVQDYFSEGTYLEITIADKTGAGAQKRVFNTCPVYAKIDGTNTNLGFLGINTAPAGHERDIKYLGAGSRFYTFAEVGEGDNKTTERTAYDLVKVDSTDLASDYSYNATNHCYTVNYKQADDNRLLGTIKYVEVVDKDGKQSERIVKQENPVLNEAGITEVELPSYFQQDNGYYKVISLLGKVQLSPKNASVSVPVKWISEVYDDDPSNVFTAVINYVEMEKVPGANGVDAYRIAKDSNGKDKLLWSDSVAVKNSKYTYSLPNSFSMATATGVELYTYDGIKVPAGMPMVEVKDHPEAHVINLDYGKFGPIRGQMTKVNGVNTLTITVGYVPSKANDTVEFTVTEIDGETGAKMGTKKFKVTPTESQTYDPQVEVKKYEGYVPWSGNDGPMTFSWESLANQGTLLNQQVYFVPEDYIPGDPYTVTVQYMNIANSRVIGSRDYIIGPEDRRATDIIGPDTLTGTDGEQYVRLDGQSAAIKHAYPNRNRIYTIYYRGINDTLNSSTVINRTEIIETYREVVDATAVNAGANAGAGAVVANNPNPTAQAPTVGTMTAAPVVTPDGGVDAGVSPGAGSTIINDDNNPLANNDGVSTSTERIEDDANPLASGAESESPGNPWIPIGITLGVIAAIGGAIVFFIWYKRRQEREYEAFYRA